MGHCLRFGDWEGRGGDVCMEDGSYGIMKEIAK